MLDFNHGSKDTTKLVNINDFDKCFESGQAIRLDLVLGQTLTVPWTHAHLGNHPRALTAIGHEVTDRMEKPFLGSAMKTNIH